MAICSMLPGSSFEGRAAIFNREVQPTSGIFPTIYRVFLPVFLGSGRLRGDSEKVRRGLGSLGKVWERSEVS